MPSPIDAKDFSRVRACRGAARPIGCEAAEVFDGGAPAAAFANELDVLALGQQPDEAAACERLVINDERTDHHSSAAVGCTSFFTHRGLFYRN